MESQLNREHLITRFYDRFIAYAGGISDFHENKYAWLCGWSDKYNQYKRFELLKNIGIVNKDSVLDIGCGGGEFVNYCSENNIDIDYTGIDINSYYIQLAKTLHPDLTFIKSDGSDLPDKKYDWAIASGIFTIETDIDYILKYSEFVMDKLVVKGFAFNLLNKTAPSELITYESMEILSALQPRFPQYKTEIIEGYLYDDFTVYLTK